MELRDGANSYSGGSWASSLRHHNGLFYATTFAHASGKTHVYTTPDIENGPWREQSFEPMLHDHSLFFDDDGKTYMLFGGNDLRLLELKEDVSGPKPGGFDAVVIKDASLVAAPRIGLPAEGSQMFKIKGKYYVVNIAWPPGDMRTAIIHRADRITGPYEGRVLLRDRGIAQGGLIDTPDGRWFAYLFQDCGAVGRAPWLVPVHWEDGWPVVTGGKAPEILDIPAGRQGKSGVSGMVASDEFARLPGEPPLPLAWQWNHNPDPAHWSLEARPGFLRLSAGQVVPDLTAAPNTLTQRTWGPQCAAATRIETGGMKDGDVAGLCLLQQRYGFAGVRCENGKKSVFVTTVGEDGPAVRESVPLEGDSSYLRVECDFRGQADRARFFHSADGREWRQLGPELKMVYTLPHFIGYRFGLFHFATREAGGFTDFDWFRLDDLQGTGG